MGKHFLIAGGAGFIGSNLSKALLDRGDRVSVLDNLMTGRRIHAERVVAHDNGTFIEADICDPIPDVDADTVINLACPASPVHYQADPIATTKTSVLGVINLLEFCKARDIRLVHASTSEVYGDPQVHPQREDYVGHVNPIGLRSCYDEGKRCAESLIFDYGRMHNVRSDMIRIFNTYGPNMQIDDGRVVSNFVVQALKGEPITVYGDGSQTRSMCFVDDMVRAWIALADQEEGVDGPVNIGNPHEITIKEFAEIVLDATGSQSELVFKPLPEDDPLKRRPDISKAKAELGWEPSTDLRDGLAKTIAYFDARLRESGAI